MQASLHPLGVQLKERLLEIGLLRAQFDHMTLHNDAQQAFNSTREKALASRPFTEVKSRQRLLGPLTFEPRLSDNHRRANHS